MTKILSKSDVFHAAWGLARAGAKRFGGSPRSYLAAALREVHAANNYGNNLSPADKVSDLANVVVYWPNKLRKTFTFRFVCDNADRVARFGDDTRFSAKQVDMINDMHARYC